jgi:hypothetical protein
VYNTQMLNGETRQEDMKLISTCPPELHGGACFPGNASWSLMPQYHYAKQLRQAFDFGCQMRPCSANTTKTAGGHTRPYLPDMVWTYGNKSSLNVAAGMNPDGSWAIGIANPTGIPSVENLNGVDTLIFPPATALALEVVFGEDVTGLAFAAHRSTGETSFNVAQQDVVVESGRLLVHVGPNELLTLRSRI